MDLLASLCLAMAAFSLAVALMARDSKNQSLWKRLLESSARQLVSARLATSPRRFLAVSIAAPLLLFGLGWLQSPLLAALGGIAGLLTPRLYLGWLVHNQSQKSEAECGRFLQAMLSGLATGGTYLDGLREARARCSDTWLQQDLDLVIQRFLLNTPVHETLRDVGARTNTPNLGLVWETLRICTENHLPTQKARTLLLELSSTVQFNVQLSNEVHARSSGLRAQIWLLAVIVPAMFLYLRLMSPDLLSVLDDTVMGRFVLFPLAALLEVGGIVLSLRVARLRP